jgi:hypothetical protein
MPLAGLDHEILAAHACANTARLPALYRRAGEAMLEGGNTDAGCFYLTHAYIYALEAGHVMARELHEILVSHGREE